MDIGWTREDTIVSIFVILLVVGASLIARILHDWAGPWFLKRMKKDDKI